MYLEICDEPSHTNIYEVIVSCSYMKSPREVKFFIKPDMIEQTILEVETVKNQFTDREYSNSIYNQCNYFLNIKKDAQQFGWFKDIPLYEKAGNTNYTIEGYEVFYYDDIGVKKNVKPQVLEPFLINLKNHNEVHKIGHYFWEEDAQKKDFQDYFKSINALIKNYLLRNKLEENLEKKSIASRVKI